MTSQVSYRIINSISGWSPAPIKVDSVSFQGGTTHTFLSCAAGPQVTRVRVDSNINAGSLDRRKYGSVQCDECGVIALPARAQPGRVYNLRLIGRPYGIGNTGDDETSVSYPVFEQLREQHDVFSDLIATAPLAIGRVSIRYGSESELGAGKVVSGNFFSGLGGTNGTRSRLNP